MAKPIRQVSPFRVTSPGILHGRTRSLVNIIDCSSRLSSRNDSVNCNVSFSNLCIIPQHRRRAGTARIGVH